MKILWFPRLQTDVDKFHITTWCGMIAALQQMGHQSKLAMVGGYHPAIDRKLQIRIPVIKFSGLRLITFWLCGPIIFLFTALFYRPNLIITDIWSAWFSVPMLFVPKRFRPLMIIDSRTPFFDETENRPSIRNSVIRKYSQWVYWYASRCLDGMTVITAHFKSELLDRISISEEKVGVWGSGVDLGLFDPAKCKSRTSPQNRKFKIIYHGEISYNRGLFEVVKGLNAIQNSNIQLQILGDSAAKSMAKVDLVSLVAELGLGSMVTFLNPVAHAEIPRILSQVDCAIMAYPKISYWNNNNPIKLCEYLAMNVFLICTDMWTFRHVASGAAGVYYLRDNYPNTITEALSYAYKNRASLSLQSSNNRESVAAHYSWAAQATNLMKFIESIK